MGLIIDKDWTTKAGYRAVIISHDLGHHCGYVGIPESHPLHGVDYGQSVPDILTFDHNRSTEKMGPISIMMAVFSSDDDQLASPEYVLEVHGSLTYSGGSDRYPAESDGLWWFGYDTAHAGDDPVTHNLAYCTSECESLAKQLFDLSVKEA